jgi:hypothetical protein
MALQKTFRKTQPPFKGVLEMPDAYWRVEKIEASKKQTNIFVSINQNNDGSFRLIAEKQYVFQINLIGKNFIAQAYDYLKTLPEFDGAIDC